MTLLELEYLRATDALADIKASYSKTKNRLDYYQRIKDKDRITEAKALLLELTAHITTLQADVDMFQEQMNGICSTPDNNPLLDFTVSKKTQYNQEKL